MMLRTLLLPVIIVASSVAKADVIIFEDFEDSTITYTSNLADALDDIGNLDYYGRLAPDTALPGAAVSYGNMQGSGYYGVQDTDSAVGGGGATPGNDLVELTWAGIDVSNFTNLSLSWYIGEDDSTDGFQDWDSGSSFQVAVQADGGGFNNIFQVESSTDGSGASGTTNATPRVDTNFDGIGDGTEITNTMTQFMSALADAGTLDIRIQFFELNAGDEDLAFDSLLLEGDAISAVPEPTSIALVGLFGTGLLFRRRRG